MRSLCGSWGTTRLLLQSNPLTDSVGQFQFLCICTIFVIIFRVKVTLLGMRWHLIMVLVCISLITDACLYVFGEIQFFHPPPAFFLLRLSFYYWVTKVIYILYIHLSYIWFAIVFFHFVNCLFIFLMVSLATQEF